MSFKATLHVFVPHLGHRRHIRAAAAALQDGTARRQLLIRRRHTPPPPAVEPHVTIALV
jgi:hypothetical protein